MKLINVADEKLIYVSKASNVTDICCECPETAQNFTCEHFKPYVRIQPLSLS